MVDRMDSVTLGDKQVRVVYFGLAATRRDDWLGGGVNNFDLTVNLGDLDLTRRPEQFDGDQRTAQTHGNYGKLHLTLSREQPVTTRVTLVPTLAAQWAASNLDSSEKFSLGGFMAFAPIRPARRAVITVGYSIWKRVGKCGRIGG